MTARIARRTAGVVSGCAAALLMFPAFANAAPSDVSISPTVDGSNATVTITNGSGSMIGCNLYGLPADSAVTADTKPVFGYTNPETLSAVIQPGATKTVPLKLFTETGPDGSATLPDGTYDLFWGCSEVPRRGRRTVGNPTPVGPNATAEPSAWCCRVRLEHGAYCRAGRPRRATGADVLRRDLRASRSCRTRRRTLGDVRDAVVIPALSQGSPPEIAPTT